MQKLLLFSLLQFWCTIFLTISNDTDNKNISIDIIPELRIVSENPFANNIKYLNILKVTRFLLPFNGRKI